MDEEIQALYGGNDFVDVSFATDSLPGVDYIVVGLGDKNKEEYADIWKVTGGVEGSFSFNIFGQVSSPEQWSDYSVEMAVNNLGSDARVEHETQGFLGDGWCKERKLSLRVYVKPQIARDILDMMFFFKKYKKHNEREPHLFRCQLVDLHRSSDRSNGKLWFKILTVFCYET